MLIAGVAEPRADWLWLPQSQVHDWKAASADGGRAYGRRAQVRSLAASAACKQFLRAHLVPREYPGLPSCCLCSTPQQARPGPLMRDSNFSPANFELLLLKQCGCCTPFLSQRARGGCVHSGHVSVLPGFQSGRHRCRWVGGFGSKFRGVVLLQLAPSAAEGPAAGCERQAQADHSSGICCSLPSSAVQLTLPPACNLHPSITQHPVTRATQAAAAARPTMAATRWMQPQHWRQHWRRLMARRWPGRYRGCCGTSGS